ncbi:phage tail assembly protein [Roseomonas chloroacetimidivorans]|uniref:phage tail assembly protein n=1 Tax=Roseomonas chloroacetimidivorans TaxID=1766656 RepID=UPI003C71F85A
MPDQDTHTISLTSPVEYEGRKYTEITLREPTALQCLTAARQVRDQIAPHTMRAHDVDLIFQTARVPREVVKKLPVSKQAEAIAFLRTFTERPDDARDTWADDRTDQLSLELKSTITVNGIDYHSLDLKEPTAGDVEFAEEALKGGNNPENLRRYQIRLVARGAGIDQAVVQHLPVRVLDEASRYLQSFT